jgi:AcrR family transcriptional regulator
MSIVPSPPTRLGRPPARDSAVTRARILDVARRSFADLGYEATTNKVLAAEAGITTGALYHYFESKFDLYVAVHEHVQAVVYERFESVVADADTFIGRIASVLDAAHELNRLDPSLARFLGSVRVDVRRHPDLAAVLRPAERRRARFYDDIVDLGVRTGEIAAADSTRTKAVIRTMLVGLTDAVSGDPDTHLRSIEGLKSLLEGTLIRPPASSGTPRP